ncbi:MAG: hypothetical protein IPH62_06805 [Ignavibacteriae bacterium]|nr:hypothetical protein [Ignavibacteriota bacterium]
MRQISLGKFLILILFLSSCSVIPIGYEASSVPLTNENGDNIKYEVLGQSEGSSGYFSLFGIIPFGSVDSKAAINDAVANLNGDALINPRYWTRTSFYFIGTYTNVEVKGDVVKIKGGK